MQKLFSRQKFRLEKGLNVLNNFSCANKLHLLVSNIKMNA